MLTRSGRGIHQSLLAEPEPEGKQPMRLKILKTRDVIDQRVRRTLVAGEITEVMDPVVVSTLLGICAAVVPGDPEPAPVAPSPEPTSESETEAEPEEAPAAEETEGKATDLTWDDIPGISDASRAILNDVAPDADPETATAEQIAEWLGSKQRAVYVNRALDDHFGRGD